MTDQEILQTIGLTPAAAMCYLALAAVIPRSRQAAWLGETVMLPRTTLYRALNELIQKGFASKLRIVSAARYRAISLEEALANYAAYQRKLAWPVIHKQLLQNPPLSGTIVPDDTSNP